MGRKFHAAKLLEVKFPVLTLSDRNKNISDLVLISKAKCFKNWDGGLPNMYKCLLNQTINLEEMKHNQT